MSKFDMTVAFLSSTKLESEV